MTDLNHLLDQIDRLDEELSKPVGHDQISLVESAETEWEFHALARTALPKLAEAVYHVLELHKPRSHEEAPDDLFCNMCGNYAPCETFIAITDTLGADDD